MPELKLDYFHVNNLTNPVTNPNLERDFLKFHKSHPVYTDNAMRNRSNTCSVWGDMALSLYTGWDLWGLRKSRHRLGFVTGFAR